MALVYTHAAAVESRTADHETRKVFILLCFVFVFVFGGNDKFEHNCIA